MESEERRVKKVMLTQLTAFLHQGRLDDMRCQSEPAAGAQPEWGYQAGPLGESSRYRFSCVHALLSFSICALSRPTARRIGWSVALQDGSISLRLVQLCGVPVSVVLDLSRPPTGSRIWIPSI